MTGSGVKLPAGEAARHNALAALDAEILGEMASSLGNAGRRAQACLEKLAGAEPDARPVLLRQAADAVYAYFVQRELCGFRRHDDVIRELCIPRSVLVRLGSR